MSVDSPSPVPPDFTTGDAERYAAQAAVPGWGWEAQRRLRAATVFVVGAGGLGGVAAGYLVAAGVGRLAVVDGGQVKLAELHRQPFHFTPEAGGGKADGLAAKLSLVNPEVHVDPFPADLSDANAGLILEGADFVLDCSSDPVARAAVNEACLRAGTPFATAATAGLDGEMLVVVPGVSACVRCLSASGQPSLLALSGGAPARASVGVAGPPVGVLGALQALAAVARLTGAADARPGVVRRLAGATLSFEEWSVTIRSSCECSRAADADNL